MRASIRIIFTNEGGDVTDITKTMPSSAMDDVYTALSECMAGCGFTDATIQEFFYGKFEETK